MYKGVIRTEDGRYKALLSDKPLGVFDDEIKAALVRDLTAIATFGELTPELNFPELDSIDFIAEMC